MPYNRYVIRPLEHGINRAYPSLHTPYGFSPWVVNGRIDQHSFKKRWGYLLDRTLPTKALNIALFQQISGLTNTRYTLYLTGTDLCKKETGTGATFSYQTEAYDTGAIVSLDGAKTTVTGNASTLWNSSGVAQYDKFIIDADLSSTVEDDAHWATVAGVTNDTTLTLSSAYAGAATSGAYRIRKIYSVPTNERWAWAAVGPKFCFTNGNVDVQYWDASGYAAALDSTNAKQARYCTEYANRLILADLLQSGARSPLTVVWSGEGDPTHFNPATDDTSGAADMLDTEDYITGLGRAGAALVVYKRDNIIIGNETGTATAPIDFSIKRPGQGLTAPNSLIETGGTNYWLGRDDFYMMLGTRPQPVGEVVRDLFFDMVGVTEAEHTWGWFDGLNSECHWVANTSSGQYDFVYSLRTEEWMVYRYAADMSSAGKGAI